MISLYLRPDMTQLLYADVKKKSVIDVRMTMELPEAYSSFFTADENLGVQKLRALFRNVSHVTKKVFEEVHIILPDTIFSYISCFDPSPESVLRTRIMQEMNVQSLTDYFIVEPMEIKAPFPKPQKSVFVLKKYIVEMLAKAAQAEKFSLVSVEAFSTAFVRGNQTWDRDYAMVEIFPTEAAIVTFSPVGGIFKSEAPHMDSKSLLADVVKGETTFSKAYSMSKVVASKHFSSVSPDLKMILFSEAEEIMQMSFVAHNHYDDRIKLPDCVNSILRVKDIPRWLALIGTLMQGFDEEVIYPEKNASIVVKNANLLPPHLQANARARHWSKMARKTLLGMAGVLTVVVLAEFSAMMYFGSFKVDKALQADATTAKNNIVQIDKELASIKRAGEENPDIVKAYERLLKSRPQSCNFTNLTMGNKTGKFSANFIRLKALSKDQIALNDYIVNLQGDDFFTNPMITTIKSGGSAFQADITMGKAGAIDPTKKTKKKGGEKGD